MNPRSTLANAKIGHVFKYCLTFEIESLNNRGLNHTLKDDTEGKGFNFKQALEDIKMNDIEDWRKENLTQNLAQLRTKCLKIAS